MKPQFTRPGKFGHVHVRSFCICGQRRTLDSSCIQVDPFAVGVGGIWAIVMCHNCGGTGVMNVSEDQKLLDVYHHSKAPRIFDNWRRERGV